MKTKKKQDFDTLEVHLYIDVTAPFSRGSKIVWLWHFQGIALAEMDEQVRKIKPLNASRGEGENEATSGPAASSRAEHLFEQLKQRTAELEEANRELRRISHYRSLFLARMSHELRTPLTSILGFSEILLEQEQLTDTQRRFCLKIQSSGLQLQASLNQLVDLSRLEAGQTELFFQEFSLREILRESCAAVARFAQKQHVKLEYDLAPEISTVVSDLGKLRQVLYNFLSWSVSRSKNGQVVNIHAAFVEPALLQIQIDDLGPSISDPERLLDPDLGAGLSDDATLIGIAIGRQILDVMSGKVMFQKRDSGLSVLIQLPARPTKG